MHGINIFPCVKRPVVSETGDARCLRKIIFLRRVGNELNAMATNHHGIMALFVLWRKWYGCSASVFVRALAVQTAAKNGHDFHNAFAPLRLSIFFFMP